MAFLIAGVLLSLGAPGAGGGGREILDYYVEHDSEQTLSAILLTCGSLLLVLFAGALRSGLRRGKEDVDGPATVAFGGGVMMALGPLLLAGTAAALSQNTDTLDPSGAEAISALGERIWVFPFLAGQSLLLFASGVAILRGGALPAWLGWVAIVLSVVSLSPGDALALPLTFLWIAVVAVLLSRRASRPGGYQAQSPAAAAH